MTAPERFADSQIPLAPRAPSIQDPLQALYVLAESFSKRSSDGARGQAQKVLLDAKPGQWRALSAVAGLSSDAVQRADRAAIEAERSQNRLQGRVAELERALEQKREENQSLARALEHAQTEATAIKGALKDEEKLRELDLAQAGGRMRHFLRGHLSLLLSDARVALDFEPPHVEAARERLDAAKELIIEEAKKSHG